MILGLFPFPRYCLGRLVMNYPGPQRPYFWGHSTTRPSVPAFEKYVNSKVQIRLFTLKKKKTLFLVMCGRAGVHRGQKRVLDPLELSCELLMGGAENGTL